MLQQELALVFHTRLPSRFVQEYVSIEVITQHHGSSLIEDLKERDSMFTSYLS